MECPYCKKEMREGFIPADRYRVRWIAGSPKGYWGSLDDREEVWLSEYPMLRVQGAEAFYCSGCKTVVVPVKEFRDNFDKLGDKVDEIGKKLTGAFEDFTAAKEKRGARREEEKQEKELEKQRENIKKGKDPWEL